MRAIFSLGAAFSVLAVGSLQAAPCDMNGAAQVPAFEAVKAAFLKANYDKVAELVTQHMAPQRADVETAISQIRSQLPDSYNSCEVIVQRRDLAMVQEITAFQSDETQTPMLFYLLALPVDGELAITAFHFDGRIGQVLDKLR